MSSRLILPLLLCAVLLRSAVATAATADWPQWLGPNRNGHVASGVTVPATLPKELKAVWKVSSGGGGEAVGDLATAIFIEVN